MTDDNKITQIPSSNSGCAPGRARAEVNFLVLPYFSLDKGDGLYKKIQFKDMRQLGNEKFEVEWTVTPNPDFGLPTDFDRRLQRAIEYSLSFMNRPIANPVPLPTYRELARIMGLTCNGRFVENVKHGLGAMNTASIMSKMCYFKKSQKAWIEQRFHLYDRIVFKGKIDADGQIADQNYAYFTEPYLSNLNSMYVRPIDFEYLKSLKPIASRLYELLGVKFYGHNEFIQYKYSTLCTIVPIHRQKALSRARQQLEAAHTELKYTEFLKSCKWISIPETKDDWYIRYEPGDRFFKEIAGLEYKPPVVSSSPSGPLVELISNPSGDSLVTDICESEDFLDILEPENTTESDDLWRVFTGIVRQYSEFDLRNQDQVWFKERIRDNMAFNSLDLTDEIKNWGDWLEIEHRKKVKGQSNKFPMSNFKGSFMNWLKLSLTSAHKHGNFQHASLNSDTQGRKGWDLPSDYRVDVM
jgi:hypothetical protein